MGEELFIAEKVDYSQNLKSFCNETRELIFSSNKLNGTEAKYLLKELRLAEAKGWHQCSNTIPATTEELRFRQLAFEKAKEIRKVISEKR